MDDPQRSTRCWNVDRRHYEKASSSRTGDHKILLGEIVVGTVDGVKTLLRTMWVTKHMRTASPHKHVHFIPPTKLRSPHASLFAGQDGGPQTQRDNN